MRILKIEFCHFIYLFCGAVPEGIEQNTQLAKKDDVIMTFSIQVFNLTITLLPAYYSTL